MAKAMNTTLEKITPQQAVTWLEQTESSGFRNRGVSRVSMLKYAADMSRGQWNTGTGESIKLAKKDGKEIVIDGQHRLRALVYATKTMPMSVVRYVEEDAFIHMDQGKSRNLNDLMVIKGWKHAPIFAKAGRDFWRIGTTGNCGIAPKHEDAASEGTILDFVERHHYKRMNEIYMTYEEYFKIIHRDGIAKKPWMLVLVCAWQQIDEKLCDQVLEFLADPEGSQAPTKEFSYAVKMIRRTRNQIMAGAKQVGSSKGVDMHNYVMQYLSVAWNLSRRKKSVGDEKSFKLYCQNKENKGVPMSI